MAWMASALGRRSASKAAKAVSKSGAAAMWRSSARQSSKAQFMPWPWKGTMAWAASPSSTARPSIRQRCRRSVPRPLTGWLVQSWSNSGSSGSASAKSRSKKARAAARSGRVWKLGSPRIGRNSVTVKVCSVLGRAMHM